MRCITDLPSGHIPRISRAPGRPSERAIVGLLVFVFIGFFPVTMLLSDDVSQVGLWLAAVCLGWLFARMLGAIFGMWRMPELRPSISSRRLGLAILALDWLAVSV